MISSTENGPKELSFELDDAIKDFNTRIAETRHSNHGDKKQSSLIKTSGFSRFDGADKNSQYFMR